MMNYNLNPEEINSFYSHLKDHYFFEIGKVNFTNVWPIPNSKTEYYLFFSTQTMELDSVNDIMKIANGYDLVEIQPNIDSITVVIAIVSEDYQ